MHHGILKLAWWSGEHQIGNAGLHPMEVGFRNESVPMLLGLSGKKNLGCLLGHAIKSTPLSKLPLFLSKTPDTVEFC